MFRCSESIDQCGLAVEREHDRQLMRYFNVYVEQKFDPEVYNDLEHFDNKDKRKLIYQQNILSLFYFILFYFTP